MIPAGMVRLIGKLGIDFTTNFEHSICILTT